MRQCTPCHAPDASVYVIHDDADTIKCRQAYENAGYYLSGTCIWEHTSQKNKGVPYVKAHTPVLFGWKCGGRHRWYADRKQVTIWDIQPVDNGDYPIALMAYPLLNSSLSNSIILAPFCGYGAALLAAEQSGRVCMMAESDEQKCSVIIKRYICFGHSRYSIGSGGISGATEEDHQNTGGHTGGGEAWII